MNKVQLFGNIGKDPETKTSANGTTITKFSLATSKKYKGEDTTQWHNCVAFGKTGDAIAQYVHKGDKLLIADAEINYGSYEKDGVTRYTTDILVFGFEFVPNGKNNSSNGGLDNVLDRNDSKDEGNDDDVPF